MTPCTRLVSLAGTPLALAVILAAMVSFAMPVAAQNAQAAPAAKQDAAKPATPKQPVYDESANASEQIADALRAAKRDNKRVLVQYGANWCGWCVKLAGLYKSDRDIAHELLYEYELVKIDVGRFDKNLDVVAKYGPGEKLKTSGIPFLTVLDADGKVLANQESGALEQGNGHDPKKVLAFLKQWQADPLDAREVLKAALTTARESDKRVFLHFGAPWCVWCRRLEAFIGRDEIAKLLAVDYVDVKIDEDRMTGGKDVEKEVREDGGGIPWYAILDADGKVLATADGPQGNVGFPVADDEIAYFISTIDKTHRKLSGEQIQTLKDALTENAKPILAEMQAARAAHGDGG